MCGVTAVHSSVLHASCTCVCSHTVLQAALVCLQQQAWFATCTVDPSANQSGREVTVEEQRQALRMLQGVVLLDERARNAALQHGIVQVCIFVEYKNLYTLCLQHMCAHTPKGARGARRTGTGFGLPRHIGSVFGVWPSSS